MFQMSLNRVHDTVKVNEGNESIVLKVNGDPSRIIAGLNRVQKTLQDITEDTPDEERKGAARSLAAVIFGDEQAEKLMEFYRDDALCVISICGSYFKDRLSKLITKAQKRQ